MKKFLTSGRLLYAGGSAHLVGDGWLPIFVFYWHRAPERSDGLKGVVFVYCVIGGMYQLSRCANISLNSFVFFGYLACDHQSRARQNG